MRAQKLSKSLKFRVLYEPREDYLGLCHIRPCCTAAGQSHNKGSFVADVVRGNLPSDSGTVAFTF
jgi:hypothetical protein